MRLNNQILDQRFLVTGLALLLFIAAYPAFASQPSGAPMTTAGQSEDAPKKKGETEESTTKTSTDEEEDDEPDC